MSLFVSSCKIKLFGLSLCAVFLLVLPHNVSAQGEDSFLDDLETAPEQDENSAVEPDDNITIEPDDDSTVEPGEGSVNNQTTTAITEVIAFIKEAMEAYANLDMETSQSNLETALGYAPDIDSPTLARIYASYGVLWVGGFADNAKGQKEFMTAKCLDAGIILDPLLSNPDIDLVFSIAANQINPDKCKEILSNIVLPIDANTNQEPESKPTPQFIDPSVPHCGIYTPSKEQKQKWEFPVYLELDSAMQGRVARLTLKYAFDGSRQYKDAPMTMTGQGYGVQLTCDEHQLRIFDPTSIEYYIEGYDNMGRLVCGHASQQGPFMVAMFPESDPPSGMPGHAPPKECTPCAPWDDTCGASLLPREGESCNPIQGCADELECSNDGICEESNDPSNIHGASKFYVNFTSGIGFGIMSQNVSYNKVIEVEEGKYYEIDNVNGNLKGAAFSGVPLRLAIGFFIKPKLSIEITGRFDLSSAWAKMTEPRSCWDEYTEEQTRQQTCTALQDGSGDGHLPKGDDERKRSVAIDTNTNALTNSNSYADKAWLTNLRVRYMFIKKGGLNLSTFGGLGYGHILYQRKVDDMDADKTDDILLSAPGAFNIELGLGLAYWFTNNVGFLVEVPIDIMAGSGFAVNVDVNIGLGFGF